MLKAATIDVWCDGHYSMASILLSGSEQFNWLKSDVSNIRPFFQLDNAIFIPVNSIEFNLTFHSFYSECKFEGRAHLKVKCNTVRSIDRCCRINDKSPLIRTYYVGGENLFHLFGGIIVFMFSHPHHLNESLYGVIQERTVNNIYI